MNDPPKKLADTPTLRASVTSFDSVEFPQAHKSEVAKRLRRIVAMENSSATAFAERCGIPRARFANALSGVSRITVEDAARVCRETRVTLEYIYLDDPKDVPSGVLRRLERTNID